MTTFNTIYQAYFNGMEDTQIYIPHIIIVVIVVVLLIYNRTKNKE